MNKKLIAAAITAGLAAPAASFAAPTLYGQLQAEIYDRDAGSSSTLEMDDSKRGRLGVKGNMDLGNGMKGIYKFEFQVETTQGDVDDGNREAFVGLKGGFGQVTLGANKGPYKYFGGVKYDPFVATQLEARDHGGMLKGQGGMANKYGQNGFLDDSISYKVSSGGLTFWAVYVLSETDPDADDTVLGLKYKFGKNGEVFFATADEDTVGTRTKFGGQWKSGPHKDSAQMEETDIDGAGTDNEAMFVGYQYKAGKNTFAVQIGEYDEDGGSANDRDYMALGVIHKFNKKARVFAGYRETDADASASDEEVISVGLRIDF